MKKTTKRKINSENNTEKTASKKVNNKTTMTMTITLVIVTIALGTSTTSIITASGSTDTDISEVNTTASNLPLTLSGTIHHFTNNNTQPPGTWLIVGTWSVEITDNNNATFVADVTQARIGEVPFEQRNEHSHHITNFKAESVVVNDTRIAINGTVDNIQNGLLRFENIPVSIVIVGGETIPYSQIFVRQGGDAELRSNGATTWYGTVEQKIQ